MHKNPFDCVVLGAKLQGMSSSEVIAILRQEKVLAGAPVVVFSGRPLDKGERDALEKLAANGVVASVASPERLLDQTALFLHRVMSQLPDEKRKLIQQLQLAATNMSGKKVLIVDDDVRNIFALTAALERKGMIISAAESGAAAIDFLAKNPDTDLVLMDIMMPDMDGYQTMRQLRKQVAIKKMPIIALTAKAMVGDREKCLAAGASDYLSKPVNVEQLNSLIQVWLSR